MPIQNEYFRLLKDNIPFRNLWFSQIIANFGDWIGLLAIYAMIQNYSDSPFLLGLIIIVKMMSFALSSPLSGFIADRFDKKWLMFWSDIARVFAVLGFFLIDGKETLFLAYICIALQMVFSSVYEPSKSSVIPIITNKKELVTANIITSFSWSAIFTLGMATGGILTDWLGFEKVFIINVFTYILSAWYIYKLDVPKELMKKIQDQSRGTSPFRGIIDGFKYIKNHKRVARPAFAKATFTSFMGGLLYLIILYSEEVLLMGSLGVGLIYSARGLGTGIGPILGRKWIPDENHWLRFIGLSMVFAGFFYFWLGLISTIWLVLILAFIAHCATGFNWVMSTVLVQKRCEPSFMGRVFSTELMAFNISQSLSVFVISIILETGWLTITSAMMVYSCLLITNGVIWFFKVGVKDEKELATAA